MQSARVARQARAACVWQPISMPKRLEKKAARKRVIWRRRFLRAVEKVMRLLRRLTVLSVLSVLSVRSQCSAVVCSAQSARSDCLALTACDCL